jgi:predicted alpha/beta hydrolase family esterase
MIEVFKIVHGLYDVNSDHFFAMMEDSNTQGHPLKIKKLRSSSRKRLTSFSRRVVRDWNALPEAVVTAPSLSCFKNRIDQHWQHHPLLYDWEAEPHQ